LDSGIQVVSVNPLGIVWIKLSKGVFGFVDDIFVCLSYVPPQKSPVYHLHDVDFFEIIQNDCSKYSAEGQIIVCGDLNARVSNRLDYIVSTGKVCHQAENLLDTAIELPTRVSCDVHSNPFGGKLIDLCKSTGLCIANGRTGKDRSRGDFTCYTSQGSSVVDYVLTSVEFREQIAGFSVCELTPHSDHTPLHLSLACSNRTCVPDHTQPGETIDRLRWEQERIPTYRELVSNQLPDLHNIVSSLNQSVISVHAAVSSVSEMLYDAAFSVCGKRVLTGRRNTSHVRHPDSPWFDETCRLEKSNFRKSVKEFNADRSEVKRQQLVIGRRRYNRAKRLAKERHDIKERSQLSTLAKRSPKSFWKLLRNKSANVKSNSSQPTLDEFHDHFKDLLGSGSPLSSDQTTSATNTDVHIEMLDSVITLDEVTTAISTLKRDKSSGTDKVIGDMFIDAADLLAPVMTDLFNYMYDNNVFPDTWSSGIIVPIPKKGNHTDVNNYRGITITSAFSKIFSIVLNTRLRVWAEGNDVFNEAQFGFRCNKSTTDSIFILHSIISAALGQKKKLYCAFVDFKKAFDLVERSYIWQKLIEIGVSTKMIKMLSSMYDCVKCCVKHCNKVSDFFDSFVGVKQGEPLSPILFLMFINDISNNLQLADCDATFEQLTIFSLLFADDTVIIGRSPNELQLLLNKLSDYCTKWSITVNIDKTKIVVFKKGNHPTDYNWYFDNCVLEVVTGFTYLGVLLSANGSFVQTQRTLAEQAKRAVFALKSILSKKSCDVKTKMYLFDTMITPILTYGAEVWGFHTALDIEKIHISFCKSVLGVNSKTSNVAVLGELGRMPMKILRQERILKYWFKLVCSTGLLRRAYVDFRKAKGSGWIISIKRLLHDLGFGEIWQNQDQLSVSIPINLIVQRLKDQYHQCWHADINSNSKLNAYCLFKHVIVFENYLSVIKCNKFRIALTKFRCSNHMLEIETGRHKNIKRCERLCKLCKMNVVEDEYHFLLVCPVLRNIRIACLKPFFTRWPTITNSLNLCLIPLPLTY
jgi:hypothetical protein